MRIAIIQEAGLTATCDALVTCAIRRGLAALSLDASGTAIGGAVGFATGVPLSIALLSFTGQSRQEGDRCSA